RRRAPSTPAAEVPRYRFRSEDRAGSRRSSGLLEQWETKYLTTVQIRFGNAAGELANPQNVALPFCHGDCAARIEKIERVRGLQYLFIGRQRQLRVEQRLAQAFTRIELLQQPAHICMLEVVSRLL